MSALPQRFAVKLEKRTPLELDAKRACAIKRNLHELVIGADADRFAAAFEEVMREPGARFGPIEVKRLFGREGEPFSPGERFTGCLRLGELGWPRLGRTRFGAWLEDAFLSDYAEIVERTPNRVVYRYLSGCPMAGSSTFTVDPLGPNRCRFRALFEYQELGGIAITVLHRFGLRMHDRVTQIQAERAAARIGATIVSSTIQVQVPSAGLQTKPPEQTPVMPPQQGKPPTSQSTQVPLAK
jgi:hypothetical protein